MDKRNPFPGFSSPGLTLFKPHRLQLCHCVLRILLRRDSHLFCKCLKKIAVIIKPAHTINLIDTVAACKKCLGQFDAAGGYVGIDGGSGAFFEETAEIGAA